MAETFSKKFIVRSVQTFKDRRDAVVSGDTDHFNYNLDRFISFCRNDDLASSVISNFEQSCEVDPKQVLETLHKTKRLPLPPNNLEEEMCMLWQLILAGSEDSGFISKFGFAFPGKSRSDQVNHYRSLVVHPFAKEITRRMGEAAKMAPPEARDLQAVPYDRIPSESEVGIFLSHKSADKPLVRRYYHALKEIGFSPWLDEANMTAGSSLERDLLNGFEESCAAVFFITENFQDKEYLASEIEYARIQKRKKGDKYSIITLLFDEDAPVPGLLEPYVWKHVNNDLEGFNELIKGLPLEFGGVRWKADAVQTT